MRRISTILIFISAMFFAGNPVKAQVLEQDSLALIDFYISTSGEDWLIPWDTSTSVNEWFGVALTEDNSRVIGITLPNNQLSGQISNSISNLSKLTSLVLSDNQINGKIPTILGILDTLIVLDLSGNLFTDSIPDEIGSLGLLKTLDLSSNELQGSVPSSLGNLDSLRILNLSQNQLSGIIPAVFSNLDSLSSLNLSSNNFTGPVPDFLQNLKVIREIDLSSNDLDGTLPSYWSAFSDLRTLRLNNNKIEGQIPNEIGGLDVLFTLNLSNNLLEGAIPQGIVNMDSLRVLDLSDNKLNAIPGTLYQLRKLQRLDLSNNIFTGTLPIFFQIPDQMEILDLHGNKFSGSIPNNYGLIFTLTSLDLSSNNLTDSIPVNFLNLVDLELLNLSGNQLTGLIDISELGISGNLQQFDVSGNRLGFEDLEINFPLFNDSTDYSPQARINDTLNVAVPTGNTYTLLVEAGGSANKYRWVLESADSLVQAAYAPGNFELSIDDFQEVNSGTYSCEVINDLVPGLIIKRSPINLFPAINTVDSLALINFNKSTGGENWLNKWDILTEPVFTWNGVEIKSGTVIGLDLDNNNLQGHLSDSIGLLGNLEMLDLSGNNLEDTLPAGFGYLSKLKMLDLSNNNFTGEIPVEISGMDSLFRINLSRNKFEGNLNDRFDSLKLLRELDLSDNDIGGELPPGISSLISLEILALGENRISGSIPAELGLLENLEILDLSENRLTGEIPEELALLGNLKELKLFRNQLSGSLPGSFTNSSTLERLFINDNKINSLPVFSDLQFSKLEARVFNNILTFDDFVDNYNGFNNIGREDEFLFLPQPTIIDRGTQILQKDESTILEIPDSHIDNRYRWLKGGTSLGTNTRVLNIDSAGIISSGTYLGQVWTLNPNFRDDINTATDSLIFSFTYTVLVAPQVPQINEPDPFCIGNETLNLVNDFGGQSGLVSRWYKVHPGSGGIPFSINQSIVYPIESESDTLYVTNGLSFNNNFESLPDTVVIISRPWILDKGSYLEVAPSDSLINARFNDGSSNSTYQWFLNGFLLVGETGQTLQKSAEGNYHVRVIRGGCSSTSLEYSPPVSNLILEVNNDLGSEISIYPNPATNLLNLLGVEENNEQVKVNVLDLRGMVVKSLVYKNLGSKFPASIDISNLNPGVYILRIYSDRYPAYTMRFVKE